MKKIFLGLLVLNIILSNDVFSKERKPDVKGGFKTRTSYIYFYDDEKLDIKSNEKLELIKYDEFGKKIAWFEFSHDSIYEKEFFKYNHKGNLLNEVNYDKSGEVVSMTKYKYDNKDNMIEKIEYDNAESVISTENIKYDDFQNIIEEIHNYSDGSNDFSYKYSLKYDKNGRIIEKIDSVYENFYKKKWNFEGKWIYKYNNKGSKIEEKKYDCEDSLELTHSYIYDIIGNIVMDEYKYPDEYIYFKISYKYNKIGNITEFIEFGKGKESDKPKVKVVYIYSKY
jgi:hypothetical protein